MKKILLVLFIGFCMQTFAQSKFAVGLIGSADITGLRATPKGKDANAWFYDQPKLGYQGGVRARYDFTRIFSMQTGFSLVSHQMSSGERFLDPLDPNDPKVPHSYVSDNTFKCFQVPVLFSFYGGHKVKFGVTAGTAYNFMYRLNEEVTAYYNTYSREYKNTRKLTSQNQYLSVIAGVGVEYAYKHFVVRAEPTGSYQMYFFDNDFANDNYRLWSVGLGLSTFYQF